jgi:hypothetical protein
MSSEARGRGDVGGAGSNAGQEGHWLRWSEAEPPSRRRRSMRREKQDERDVGAGNCFTVHLAMRADRGGMVVRDRADPTHGGTLHSFLTTFHVVLPRATDGSWLS